MARIWWLYHTIFVQIPAVPIRLYHLNHTIYWTKLKLYIDKCPILTFLRSTSPPYYIDNTILNRTNQHVYLGILFHSQMSFSTLINNIANNAMKFVRRNLNDCNESLKALGLVRICSLDLHLPKNINTIERVQRIATRWVKSNYNWEKSVSNMLSELQWPILLTRKDLQYFQKVFIT